MAFFHRQLSLKYSNVDVRWNVTPILEGDMSQLPPVSSHKIRVFLSSTFSDMISERNALMEHVYPALKDFCRKYHLELQVMDLRWGIRNQSHDDHTIIDFCLREIENCKKISLGPNFVVLLGQKYGFRPFPPRINGEEFEQIKQELESKNISTTLLNAWYKKNTNVTPNVYMLQPISSGLSHYVSEEKEVHERALKEWEVISAQLQELLRLGVSYCFEVGRMTVDEKDKYFTSVTEYEIEKGLLEAEKPHEEVLCFTRHITNLEKNLHHTKAQKFIDTTNGGRQIDGEAQNLLNVLKFDKIPAVLSDERNSEYFDVSWQDPEHSNPNDDPEYLQSFCRVFQDKMCWLINRSVVQTQSISCNSQVIEILQHLKMGKKLSGDFRGREMALRKIRSYLGSSSDRPLVLFGESGSGKTSVIAKVAERMRKWFVEPNRVPVVVLRFLGTTSHSCSIRLVLGSICWHIASTYGVDTSTIPGDCPGLVAYFLDLIKIATPEKPLMLLLDGLDQLSSVHRAHNLAWLPKVLPPNVHVILSTLSDKYELLDTLRLYFPNPENFIEILPLGCQLSINLLKDWLYRANRELTPEQFEVVEAAISRCTLPLYTRLVFEEVCRWCSYFRAEEIVLEPTIHAIINKLFDRVEKYHGYIFVSHTLAYLTASKNGLSDMEIEDILSLDDEVLNDVFLHWLPPVRRIPPLLIPRLQDELSCYILEREANGTIVFYWYHSQFIEVSNERYLSKDVDRYYVHSTLAHYFMGTWGGGKKKPFKYSFKLLQNSSIKNREAEADRMVPKQPLDFGPDPNYPGKLNYNLRKLSELPYHLIASHLTLDLKNQVLFNYEWLHAKLSAMSLHEVLSDFQQAMDSGTADADIQLVASALRVGGTHLNQNPDMLAFDLLGRLLCYYDQLSESPNSPYLTGGPLDPTAGVHLNRIRRIRQNHNNLQSLLHQCDTRSIKHSALVPVLQCFDSPNTMSVYILEGHSKVATDLVFSPKTTELISVSHERIAFWDLNSGELSRSIFVEDVYPGRKKLFLSDDGRYLVVDCDLHDAPVHIYDMKTLQLLHSCGARLSTQRRVFLSGSLLCRQKTFIDISKGSIVKTMDDFVTTRTYVTCALSLDNKLILVGDQNETKLFDFNSEKQIAAFRGDHPPSAMAITSDSTRAHIGYAENCLFCVFNIDRDNKRFGQLLMTFDHPNSYPLFRDDEKYRAFKGNEVSEISSSPVDQNFVLLNINRFYLICLNTLTESRTLMDTKKLIGRTGRQSLYISCSMFSGNGQFVLSGIENFLDIWRPEDGELVHTISLHTTPPFPIAASRNLIATGSTVNTAVRIWDLDNIQESKTPKVKAYQAPVDCISCVDQSRLVFVKSQYSLSNMKGFKYMDYFSIDVWNVTTGSCREYLPFAKYGRLLRMHVSVDGTRMALLLNAVDDWYIALIDLCPDGSVRVLKHKKCASFEVANSWEFLASYAKGESLNEIKLWDLRKGREILCMSDATSPVFTHDSRHFLFVDLGCSSSPTILVYSLVSFGPACKITCKADRLLPLPLHSHHFIATRCASEESNGDSEVSLWTFSRRSEMPEVVYSSVSSQGFLDVSKDGSVGVDGRLQVFQLFTGELKTCFLGNGLKPDKEFGIVRITHDGFYVIWVDDMSVKVGHVETGNVIASASAHERLTCLHTMDYGYIIVVGGTDGHLLTMKLAVPGDDGQGRVTYRAQGTEDRRFFLLDTSPCSKSAISKMDRQFQIQPRFLNSDRELPLAGEQIQSDLLQRADVPLTVISTSRQDSPSEEVSVDYKRRSSTPINLSHITNVVQSSAFLALLATEDSDTALPRLIGCSSASNLSNFGTLKAAPSRSKLLQARSKSAQDLPRLINAGKLTRMPAIRIHGRKNRNSPEHCYRREPRNSKDKISLPRDEYRVDKAIEIASSVLMNCFKITAKDSKNGVNSHNGSINECVTSM